MLEGSVSCGGNDGAPMLRESLSEALRTTSRRAVFVGRMSLFQNVARSLRYPKSALAAMSMLGLLDR